MRLRRGEADSEESPTQVRDKIVVFHRAVSVDPTEGIDVRHHVPAAKDLFADKERVVHAERAVSGLGDVNPLAAVHVRFALRDKDAQVRVEDQNLSLSYLTNRMSAYRAMSLNAAPMAAPTARRHCRSQGRSLRTFT